jgi:uncharacterized membrane protein YkvI
MDKTKGALLLGFIIALIFLFLSVLLQWIKNEHFVWLESIISYKWMLIILLIVILSLVYALIYSKIFGSKERKKDIEKICPRCNELKLKLIKSTIRSLTYKCSECGFDHRELKEGQTNTIRT